jgi:diketogulonate reductase-like aldo/keto reductase
MSSSTNQTVPFLEMNDGHRIPQLGFGVFKVDPDRTADVVAHALHVGYRSIDTATLYDNEDGVGAAIAESGIAREKLFVTTKVWNDDQGHDATLRAFERSLRRLSLEYVDLYLIHWPVPAQDRYVETWQALTELKADGRARSIGVSNFQIEHLRRVIAQTGVTPAVNQIELHPHLQQAPLRRFHDEHGILTEAWSPLGRGRALDDSVVTEIARRHERTAAQVVLRWHLQLGNVVIPKSATPARVEENFAVFDFELSAPEMEAIAGLEAGSRIGPDPDRFD